MHTSLRRRAAAAIALTATLLLSGCGLSDFAAQDPEPVATKPTPSPTPAFDSQFTRDGTFQSHVDIDGMDFVYTLWPTKSTPRTNLWFPKGNKYFSFTLQAYDLDQDLRDKFSTKRKVWLDRIRVESETTTKSGAVERPYDLDATASRITFDPEPVTTKRGMLITSPKGAFELRNQKIGTLAMDTSGLNLIFRATVHIQRSAGSKTYYKETIRQRVPIAIFASDQETVAAKIPIDAN
ncbi:hypothetical protein GEV29_07925 [Aeromicrobium sp. SMF47]|uniref:hypothetical protein n=1 Tax=Aeromicrobium TaxID=2040 RepID=UPI00129E6CF3|nr:MULTISPECIES: hypothetical protein [Aeromicrobium]MRJ76458.1 hypothetical protein [Aeromicrobium yanjiei]MRK00810.1 hypothetical protein [Aeromicrobium sp. S22]